VFTPGGFPDRGRAVAVEPMTCPPDALNSGLGLLTVAPGESWTGSWGLRPS
jgi:aldose 1-epimerase